MVTLCRRGTGLGDCVRHSSGGCTNGSRVFGWHTTRRRSVALVSIRSVGERPSGCLIFNDRLSHNTGSVATVGIRLLAWLLCRE